MAILKSQVKIKDFAFNDRDVQNKVVDFLADREDLTGMIDKYLAEAEKKGLKVSNDEVQIALAAELARILKRDHQAGLDFFKNADKIETMLSEAKKTFTRTCKILRGTGNKVIFAENVGEITIDEVKIGYNEVDGVRKLVIEMGIEGGD